jgi:8-oxo-dGTP pyrophosphatase MutT (NUDIX family)
MKILTNAFIFHEQKLLFVFHKKLQKWMHVGGHAEEGEYFDESLFREIKEETGLKVKILNQEKKISEYELAIPFFIRTGDDKKNSELYVDYVCEVEGNPKIVLQKEELLDYKWITEKEIDEIDTFPLIKILAKKAFNIYKKE